MMNAVKYTYDVKTKTMNYVEYKNSVEKPTKDGFCRMVQVLSEVKIWVEFV